MLKITKVPKQIDPVRIPEVDAFLYGSGRVEFDWIFTRKVSFWFLLYFLEPGACLHFSDRTVRPADGEFLLIPPFTAFRSVCEKPFDHLYVHFNASGPYSHIKPEVMIFDRNICGTLDLLLDPETFSDAAVYAMLFSALAMIPKSQFLSADGHIDDRIGHAMSLMGRGMKKGEVCRKIGMSPTNFQRKFKEETGVSPHQYRIQLALEKARTMLAFSSAGIPEIAEECGFSDRYSFSKAFRKTTGVPPGKYRSSNRTSDPSRDRED